MELRLQMQLSMASSVTHVKRLEHGQSVLVAAMDGCATRPPLAHPHAYKADGANSTQLAGTTRPSFHRAPAFAEPGRARQLVLGRPRVRRVEGWLRGCRGAGLPVRRPASV